MSDADQVKADQALLEKLESLAISDVLTDEERQRYDKALKFLEQSGGLGSVAHNQSITGRMGPSSRERLNTLSANHRQKLQAIVAAHFS
jgi:hypothetical protein